MKNKNYILNLIIVVFYIIIVFIFIDLIIKIENKASVKSIYINLCIFLLLSFIKNLILFINSRKIKIDFLKNKEKKMFYVDEPEIRIEANKVGKYTITVQAIDENSIFKNGSESEAQTFEVHRQQLEAPTFSVKKQKKKEMLFWEEVVGAGAYLVIINGVEQGIQGENYIPIPTKPGQYYIDVIAIGDPYRTFPSEASRFKYLHPGQLDKINPSLSDYKVEWTHVNGATGYIVKVIHEQPLENALETDTQIIITDVKGEKENHINDVAEETNIEDSLSKDEVVTYLDTTQHEDTNESETEEEFKQDEVVTYLDTTQHEDTNESETEEEFKQDEVVTYLDTTQHEDTNESEIEEEFKEDEVVTDLSDDDSSDEIDDSSKVLLHERKDYFKKKALESGYEVIENEDDDEIDDDDEDESIDKSVKERFNERKKLLKSKALATIQSLVDDEEIEDEDIEEDDEISDEDFDDEEIDDEDLEDEEELEDDELGEDDLEDDEELEDDYLEAERKYEKEKDISDDSSEEIKSELIVPIISRGASKPYEYKLKMANDNLHERYSLIKNTLLKYRKVKSRISKKGETFRKGSNVLAIINVVGKTLRVYLPIDPSTLDNKVYHHTDVSMKKRFVSVPSLFKVKSNRACKRVIKLIDELAIQNEFIINKKYQEKDYTSDFSFNSQELIIIKNYTSLLKDEYFIDDNIELTEEEINGLVTLIDTNEVFEEVISQDLYINNIAHYYEDNEIVDINTLKDKNLINDNVNHIKILIDGSLNKPLNVYANDFSVEAIKLIVFTKGNAFKLIEKVDTDNIN